MGALDDDRQDSETLELVSEMPAWARRRRERQKWR